jgi:hypothetical protein
MESTEAEPPEDDSIISAERRQYYMVELMWLGIADPDNFIDQELIKYAKLDESGAREDSSFDNHMTKALKQLREP